MTALAHLSNRVIVLDRQESTSQQDLELLDDDLSGHIDTDKGTDDIPRFTRPELGRSVDRFRLPFWIAKVFRLVLSSRSNHTRGLHLILVQQLFALYEKGDNTFDGVWSVSEMLPDRFCDLVQQNACWVEYPQTSDRRNILCDDIFRLCSRMQEPFAITDISANFPLNG